jgi:hypothetical protein
LNFFQKNLDWVKYYLDFKRNISIIEISLDNGDEVSSIICKENELYHAHFHYYGNLIHAYGKTIQELREESVNSFNDYFQFCKELESETK